MPRQRTRLHYKKLVDKIINWLNSNIDNDKSCADYKEQTAIAQDSADLKEKIELALDEIGQYYDEHFSEEEMEILYEIVRGNVDVDTLKEKLVDFFEDSDIPTLPFFDLKTDEGLLDRLDYDFGYVGGTGKRAGYRTH